MKIPQMNAPVRRPRRPAAAALLLSLPVLPLPLLSLSAAPAAAAVFTVGNTAELTAATRAMVAGDTILLAPGDYGRLWLYGRKVTGGRVHITSADPANPARFSAIEMNGAEGFLLTRLAIAGSKSPLINIVARAHNIAFHDNSIEGLNGNLNPWDDGNTALWVRNSTSVTLTGNRFRDLRTAIYLQNAQDVIIGQNSFTHLREGINVAASSRTDIVGNLFHSFYPNYAKGEHPDGIQFWTSGETRGSEDVRIVNNYFAFGGQRPVQGIFVRSEQAENSGLPVYHRNFTVSGNVYYGSSVHGITLSSVHGVEVSNNVVAASPWAETNGNSVGSTDGTTAKGYQPQIRIPGAVDGKAWNNIGMGGVNWPNVTVGDHLTLYNSHTKKGEPWPSLIAYRPTEEVPPLSAFVSAPGSVARLRGIGISAPFQAGPVPAPASAFARNSPSLQLGRMPAKP